MSITRSQIARELMAEGGAPRQGYFLGKIVRKIKDDIIPNELKSPAGLAAAALAVDQFGIPIGGGKKIGGGQKVSGFLGDIFRGGNTSAGTTGGPIDKKTGDIFRGGGGDDNDGNDDKGFISKIGSGIGSAFNFLKPVKRLLALKALSI